MSNPPALSRRERQIMDAIYQIGPSSVADVRAAMEDPPSYSSVRTLLGVLVDKGHLQAEREGNRYRYRPTVPPEEAGRTALAHLARTFFGGSVEGLVHSLLQADDVDASTLDHLADLVDQARKDRP